jgi:hypothetical protein
MWSPRWNDTDRGKPKYSQYSVGLRTERQGLDPRQGQRVFLLASVQTGLGTGGPFPGGKARPGRDADHLPPYSAEVKNE